MNIKLSTLTEAMDSVLEGATQEYDKATGEIHFIYDGMVDGEINQELEEYICESDDFIALPEKYEINDYEIMREFIYTLRDNKNVSIAIYDEYSGFDNLGGLQIQGTVEMVQAGTDEYFEVMDYKKLPHDAFDKMECPMHLIKMMPRSMDYLNSELKKLGYGRRQHLEL